MEWAFLFALFLSHTLDLPSNSLHPTGMRGIFILLEVNWISIVFIRKFTAKRKEKHESGHKFNDGPWQCSDIPINVLFLIGLLSIRLNQTTPQSASNSIAFRCIRVSLKNSNLTFQTPCFVVREIIIRSLPDICRVENALQYLIS